MAVCHIMAVQQCISPCAHLYGQQPQTHAVLPLCLHACAQKTEILGGEGMLHLSCGLVLVASRRPPFRPLDISHQLLGQLVAVAFSRWFTPVIVVTVS
jgi:hypothetical protein